MPASARNSRRISRPRRPRPHHHPSRPAFTLIELLVVIATISILATISLQVAGALITQARESKTKTILWRLQKAVERKAEALQRLQKRSIVYTDDTWEMVLLNKTPQYANLPLQTKRTLVRKLQAGHYLPQDRSELWDASIYPPGITLEDALLNTPAFGYSPVESDDDLHMIDAWGNPILFLRWPTNLFKAHPELLPAVYDKDPDDPLGTLAGLFTPGQPFDPLMAIQMPEPCRPYVMVFVSAGPDGMLGVEGPLGDVTSEVELGDNLWSVNVR